MKIFHTVENEDPYSYASRFARLQTL